MSWVWFSRLMFIINAIVLMTILVACFEHGVVIAARDHSVDASGTVTFMLLYALANFVLVWRSTVTEYNR